MASQTVDVMVEGGKATAAPPLGPALGPMGVNIGQVVMEINKKTSSFAGMQVPVKVIIEKESKTFTITVGTPPTSALIKKEAGIEKGASNPLAEKVANLVIEQVIKIAKMKHDDTLGKTNLAKVKEIVGSCNSLGVMVEGMPAKLFIKELEQGKFKSEIESGKTEISEEEKKKLAEEKKRLQEDIEKRRAEFEKRAKDILGTLEGKTVAEKRKELEKAGIPVKIIDELAPREAAPAAPGAPGAKPAGK